jgi:hypothetical protein
VWYALVYRVLRSISTLWPSALYRIALHCILGAQQCSDVTQGDIRRSDRLTDVQSDARQKDRLTAFIPYRAVQGFLRYTLYTRYSREHL